MSRTDPVGERTTQNRDLSSANKYLTLLPVRITLGAARNEPEFGIRDLLSRYNETGFAKQWGQPAQGRSRRRALSREKSLCQIIVYARIHISA